MSNFTDRFDPDDGDLMTVQEWLDAVDSGLFIDYDGYGYGCQDDLLDPTMPVKPSLKNIPNCSTHILWFNR